MKNEKLQQIYSLFCGLSVYADENQEARESITQFMDVCIKYLTSLNNPPSNQGIAVAFFQKTKILKDLPIDESYKQILTHIMDDCVNVIRKKPSLLIPAPIATHEFNHDILELNSVKDSVLLATTADNNVPKVGIKRKHSEETQQSSNNDSNNNNNAENNNNSNNNSNVKHPKHVHTASEIEILNEVVATNINNPSDLKNILQVILDLLKYYQDKIIHIETEMHTFNNSSYENQLKNFKNSKMMKYAQHNSIGALSRLIIKIVRSTHELYIKEINPQHLIDLDKIAKSFCLALNHEYVNDDIDINKNLIYLLDYSLDHICAIDFFSPAKLIFCMILVSDKIQLRLLQGSYDQIPSELQRILTILQEAKSNRQTLNDKQRTHMVATIKKINTFIAFEIIKCKNDPNANYSDTLNIIKNIINVFLGSDNSFTKDFPEALPHTQVLVDMYLNFLMNDALPHYVKSEMYDAAATCIGLFVQYAYSTGTVDKITNMHTYLISLIESNHQSSEENKYFACIIPTIRAYISALICYADDRKFDNPIHADIPLDKDRARKELLYLVLLFSKDIFENNIKNNLQINSDHAQLILNLVKDFNKNVNKSNFDDLQSNIDVEVQALEDLLKSVGLSFAESNDNAVDLSRLSNSSIFSRNLQTNNNNNLSNEQNNEFQNTNNDGPNKG